MKLLQLIDCIKQSYDVPMRDEAEQHRREWKESQIVFRQVKPNMGIQH